MGNKKPETKHLENSDRLARCALAAGQPDSLSQCPDDDAFARFLEAGPGAVDQQAMLEHISTCEACCQKWLDISEVLDSLAEKEAPARSAKPKLLAAVGSMCVLTAGIMLYLSIDYQPMVKTEKDHSLATESEVVSQAQGTDQADDAKALTQEPALERNIPMLSTGDEHPDRLTMESQRAGTIMRKDEAGIGWQAEGTGQPTAAPRPTDAEIGAVKMEGVAEKAIVNKKHVKTGQSAAAPALEQKLDQADGVAPLVEQFITCCGDARENRIQQQTVEKLIKQGRMLLRSGRLPGEEKALVEEMIDVLGQMSSKEKGTYAEVCERAVAFAKRKGYNVKTPNPQ